MLDRIYHDFQGLRVFFEDPVLPDNGFEGATGKTIFNWTLHLQDEVRVTRPTGNIFSDQYPPRLLRRSDTAIARRRQQYGLLLGQTTDRCHHRF